MRNRNPFRDALNGILAAYRSERNLRIHITIAILTITLGFFMCLSLIEWCLIALCIALVVTAELINTAIEVWVDLVSPDQNPLAGKAKDVAAGAVLVAVAFSAFIGGIIFIPKLWLFFSR